MRQRLDREGKTGAISRIGYDTWWNGGMRSAVYYHNMVGILTETGDASASPSVHDSATFPGTFSDGRPTLEPTTHYPSPYRGGEWHLRDSCDYMMTASMAVLDLGAQRRSEWLYDIYRMGRDAIETGRGEVYIVSRDQWDPGTAIKLVNVLRWGGVEIERTRRPLLIGATEYPANSFVIRGNQAFRPYLTDLLNPQVYPNRRSSPDGPPDRPYDITGWTLPMQMGVDVDRHSDVLNLPRDALVPVDRAELGATQMPPSAGGGVRDAVSNAWFLRSQPCVCARHHARRCEWGRWRTDQPAHRVGGGQVSRTGPPVERVDPRTRSPREPGRGGRGETWPRSSRAAWVAGPTPWSITRHVQTAVQLPVSGDFSMTPLGKQLRRRRRL